MSDHTHHDGLPSLFSMTRRLVHSWWQADRIRVSPAAGQLLRLHPPCWLFLDGQYVEVADRVVRDGTPTVLYHCRTRRRVIVKVDSIAPWLEWHQRRTKLSHLLWHETWSGWSCGQH